MDQQRKALAVFIKLNHGIPESIEYAYSIKLIHCDGQGPNHTMEGIGRFQSGWKNGWESYDLILSFEQVVSQIFKTRI